MFDVRSKVWYASSRMDNLTINQSVSAASAAVDHAQDVRAAHRKRTPRGSYQREADIQLALSRLRRAMAPIRATRAKLAGGTLSGIPLGDKEALTAASEAIQRERRKLWKMQKRQKGKKNGKRGRRRAR